MSHSAHCARQICKRDSSIGERRPDGATAWGRILWRPGRNSLGRILMRPGRRAEGSSFPSFTESTKLARSQDSPIHSRTRGKASSLSPPMQARACAEPNVPARIEARREDGGGRRAGRNRVARRPSRRAARPCRHPSRRPDTACSGWRRVVGWVSRLERLPLMGAFTHRRLQPLLQTRIEQVAATAPRARRNGRKPEGARSFSPRSRC